MDRRPGTQPRDSAHGRLHPRGAAHQRVRASPRGRSHRPLRPARRIAAGVAPEGSHRALGVARTHSAVCRCRGWAVPGVSRARTCATWTNCSKT
jgi:hypothetical protein